MQHDKRGNTKMTPVNCTHCGGPVGMDAQRANHICQYCGSQIIVEREKISPVESVLGFVKDQQKRIDDIKKEKLENERKAREKAEKEREEAEKSLKKYWWVYVLVMLIIFGYSKVMEMQQTQVALNSSVAGVPTPTPIHLPKVNIMIFTCDTGTDIFNGMGEVTNGYVMVQNVGEVDISNVRVELRANDEGKTHPDKYYELPNLPFGYQIPLRLTVDTKNNVDTELEAVVSGDNNVYSTTTKSSCNLRTVDQQAVDSMGVLFKLARIGITK
ncbi:MAG: hypothetical protein NTW32_27545 [Chloroflexi bacterium]|nr:hypothetical protein [Chloroflexota bacterium]